MELFRVSATNWLTTGPNEDGVNKGARWGSGRQDATPHMGANIEAVRIAINSAVPASQMQLPSLFKARRLAKRLRPCLKSCVNPPRPAVRVSSFHLWGFSKQGDVPHILRSVLGALLNCVGSTSPSGELLQIMAAIVFSIEVRGPVFVLGQPCEKEKAKQWTFDVTLTHTHRLQ